MKQILIAIVLLGSSCKTENILNYKYHRYYSENNYISSKENSELHQEVCYNIPKVIDDEHCHTLTFTFNSIEKIKEKVIYNLQTDTLIVQCDYGVFSVWNWSAENNKISGTVEILNWDSNMVELKEDIIIDDIRRKKRLTFRGIRKFRKKVEANK